MNFIKLLAGWISPEELDKRYVKKNKLQHQSIFQGDSHGYKKRGVGYTRRLHEESKTRRKMAARSRRINRRK